MDSLPTKPTGVMSLMAQTSTEIDFFSDSIIQDVKEGNENAIKVLVQMKAIEKVSERVCKEIKDNCMREADLYPGNSFDFLGNTIQKVDVRTEYDFTACEDPEWNRLENTIKNLKALQKQRESFLRGSGEPFTILNEETGEVNKVYPPIKKTTPGLKVNIR